LEAVEKQHRAVIFGHALPPLVKTRGSFPPGEDQRIDNMQNMKKKVRGKTTITEKNNMTCSWLACMSILPKQC